MADIEKLKTFVDAYGSAVRSGIITPCEVDEVYVRAQFGLPAMTDAVKKDWKDNPTRKPLTIKQSQLVDENNPQIPQA